MLVKRVIQSFIMHLKNSLFFSSGEGVETALTFLTLIETCKNVGLDTRDYIATTMKLLIAGTGIMITCSPCHWLNNDYKPLFFRILNSSFC